MMGNEKKNLKRDECGMGRNERQRSERTVTLHYAAKHPINVENVLQKRTRDSNRVPKRENGEKDWGKAQRRRRKNGKKRERMCVFQMEYPTAAAQMVERLSVRPWVNWKRCGLSSNATSPLTEKINFRLSSVLPISTAEDKKNCQRET
jgi:hypothetical protein